MFPSVLKKIWLMIYLKSVLNTGSLGVLAAVLETSKSESKSAELAGEDMEEVSDPASDTE